MPSVQDKQIDPRHLTDEDIEMLQKGCQGSYDKASAVDQVRAALAGLAWIFRVEGPNMKGLYVLARGSVADRELVLTCMAGTNVLKHIEECYQLVKARCRSVGARRLVGFVSRKGLASIYERKTGLKPVATIFSEDL